MKEVYLLWESYKTNKLLAIGVLKQLDNDKYSFKYFDTAKDAMEQGCFLPFPYSEEEIFFETLPDFFEQRILKGDFNTFKFNLKNETNKLNYLVYRDSVKNSDNFKIVDEEKFQKMK